jgi:hypothetical protein
MTPEPIKAKRICTAQTRTDDGRLFRCTRVDQHPGHHYDKTTLTRWERKPKRDA